METELPAAYGQLLSTGMLWISVHCAGMCGPLLAGLDVSGMRRGSSISQGFGRIASYQGGKALTYAFLGAVAGTLGNGVSFLFAKSGVWLFLMLSVVIGLYALRRIGRRMFPAANKDSGSQAQLVQLSSSKIKKKQGIFVDSWQQLSGFSRKAVHHLAKDRSLTSTIALGALLGFLPCMIPTWVLGLAASTGSPLHGVLLMLLLVLLTTPIISLVSLLPRLLQRTLFTHAEKVVDFSLLVSASWMLLMSLAAAEIIPHQAWHFQAMGKDFTLMFF